MICLRCGYCCCNYFVVIVNDPEKGLEPDNLMPHDGKSPCKHLQGDEPGKHSCALHGYDWYKDTPCFQHGQVEKSQDTPCRIGEYIMKLKKEKDDEKYASNL